MPFEDRVEKQRIALEQQRQQQDVDEAQKRADADKKELDEQAHIEAIKQDPRWHAIAAVINSPEFIEAMDAYCEAFTGVEQRRESKQVKEKGLFSGFFGDTRTVYETVEVPHKPTVRIHKHFGKSFDQTDPLPVGYVEVQIILYDNSVSQFDVPTSTRIMVTWRDEATEIKRWSETEWKVGEVKKSSGKIRQAGLAIEVPSADDTGHPVFDRVFYTPGDFLDFIAKAIASNEPVISRYDNSY